MTDEIRKVKTVMIAELHPEDKTRYRVHGSLLFTTLTDMATFDMMSEPVSKLKVGGQAFWLYSSEQFGEIITLIIAGNAMNSAWFESTLTIGEIITLIIAGNAMNSAWFEATPTKGSQHD